MLAAVVDGGAVEVGQQDPGRVGGGDAGRRRPASACLGRRHVRRVERAGHLQRDDPRLGRRLGGELLQRVERAGGDDLARRRCGWPGRARAPRSRRAPRRGRRRARRTCRSAPARRRRPSRGRGRRPASPRPRPAARRRGRRRRARRRCGRRRPTTSCIGSCSAASSAAATSSGWVRAVSLISSAPAVGAEVDQVDPGERGPPAQAGLGAGQVEPGSEEAGLLGALAGREYGEHVYDSPGYSVGHVGAGTHQIRTRIL